MVYVGPFETPESCDAWKQEYALPFPVVPDPDGTLFQRVTSGWVPWSVLIAADGRVVFSENEFDEEGFAAAIEELFRSAQPPAALQLEEHDPSAAVRRIGPTTTVILGGGIGGVVTARRLRARLGRDHRVVVVDRSPSHLFQPSLLWILEGARREEQIKRPLDRLRRHGIEFVNDEVREIDLHRRRVTTAGDVLAFDYLVVALGARTAPESVEGFSEMAYNLYDADGCLKIRAALESFDGGRVGILVTSMPFKCPAAPYEAAFLVDSALRRSGVRDRAEIHVFTPEHQPMPVAEAALGKAIERMLRRRDIRYHPLFTFERMRPSTNEIVDADGEAEEVDLLIAIPPHEAPEVVRAAGLTGVSGWVHVDPSTLRTAHPDVYAIGDVTSIRLPSGKSLPKAGVFAHHEAEVVAKEIAGQTAGREISVEFTGEGACWVETGDGRAAFASGNFYGELEPRMKMVGPSRLRHWSKVAFEKWWLWRWF